MLFSASVGNPLCLLNNVSLHCSFTHIFTDVLKNYGDSHIKLSSFKARVILCLRLVHNYIQINCWCLRCWNKAPPCCCTECLISVVQCCAGFPSLPLTDGALIQSSPNACCLPVWYAAYSPAWPQRCTASLFNHSSSKAISRQPVQTTTPRMWEGRGKASQQQKCNLEAVLRERAQLSNRLLVREWCLTVALHKPWMCGHMPLWALQWDDGTLEPKHRVQTLKMPLFYLKLYPYLSVSQHSACWPGCASEENPPSTVYM